MNDKSPPWNQSAAAILSQQGVAVDKGLSSQDAQGRLAQHGLNAYKKPEPERVGERALRQLREVPNLILLFASVLSLVLAVREGSGFAEPLVIAAVVVLNVVLAVTQERGAEKALDALSSLNDPVCQVLRAGERRELATAHVVPGDVLLLKTGNLVAADARLVKATDLAVDESSLTGESEPAQKDASAIVDADAPVGDRLNMVHAGSMVAAGNAVAVVTATGMQSEMGRIAGYLGSTRRLQTPLQRRLGGVSKAITGVALVSAAILFVVGLRQGEDLWVMLLGAVSLAVAAVPETLQLIVTMTLSQGVRKMVRKNALIRRLPAVETLGSVSVICSDKTGTLTQNRMEVRRLWVPGEDELRVGGEGRPLAPETGAELTLLQHLALASTATVQADGKGGHSVEGDATESAIMRLLLAAGHTPDSLLERYPRVGEVPFSSSRKMMTSIHKLPEGGYLVLTKGAFDRLPFDEATRAEHRERQVRHDAFAADALRVIALGSRLVSSLPQDGDLAALERGLTFEGIVGLIDPPRPEAARAIANARNAGIRTVMITGDHAATASAVARQLGLLGVQGTVVTGRELAAMTDDELVRGVRSHAVYARVSPEDKIRIVKAWQEQGEVVAMTGDGVNDAPALRAADVGVAMGRTGTEVAKAAADMVLTDDNFATIVEAVREGRGVFSNIRRTIYFLLVCNLSEIALMLAAQLLGWGSALTPVMLLLINVLGDGVPGLRLAWDVSDPRIMVRGPIGRTESFFSSGVAWAIARQTIAFAAVGLVAFWLGAVHGVAGAQPNLAVGQTMAFLVVAFTSILHAFNVRSRRSVFRRRIDDNWPLVWGALAMVALFSLMVLLPQLGSVFGLVPLSAGAWVMVLALSLVPTAVAEAFKLLDR